MIGQSFVFGGIAGAAGGPIDLPYLIVGGGAVGGLAMTSISTWPQNVAARPGGGGGAGALIESTATFNKGTQYTITIGGSDTDSSIEGADITAIIAEAGGYGGGNETVGSGRFASWAYYNRAGAEKNGGCGGGAGCSQSQSTSGGAGSVGFNGGSFSRTGDYTPRMSAGGGGMGAVGGNCVSPGNNGGIGSISTFITTTTATTASIGQVNSGNLYFSGGGGGAIRSWTKGYGGIGGGGNGSSYGFTYGTAGAANTGGGGGGMDGDTGMRVQGPYYGGSGVVCFKVPTSDYSGVVTGAPTTIVEGSNTILIFKSSGTYTP